MTRTSRSGRRIRSKRNKSLSSDPESIHAMMRRRTTMTEASKLRKMPYSSRFLDTIDEQAEVYHIEGCEAAQEPYSTVAVFACVLRSRDLPGMGRDVQIDLDSRNELRKPVLTMLCAGEGHKLLEIQLDLLRFRKSAQKPQVSFNAKDDDIEWWILEFCSFDEVRRFKNRLFAERLQST